MRAADLIGGCGAASVKCVPGPGPGTQSFGSSPNWNVDFLSYGWGDSYRMCELYEAVIESTPRSGPWAGNDIPGHRARARLTATKHRLWVPPRFGHYGFQGLPRWHGRPFVAVRRAAALAQVQPGIGWRAGGRWRAAAPSSCDGAVNEAVSPRGAANRRGRAPCRSRPRRGRRSRARRRWRVGSCRPRPPGSGCPTGRRCRRPTAHP